MAILSQTSFFQTKSQISKLAVSIDLSVMKYMVL